jgi:opacity protein-like surface antigen
MKKIFLVGLMIVAFSSFVLAAPVNNVISEEKKEGYRLKVTAEGDFISERELDVANESVELETNFYQAKIACGIGNRIDIYALLGSIKDAQVTEKEPSNTYKYFFDDDFAWGFGASVLIHEFENGLRIGADGKYRAAEVDLIELDINGTKYGLADISEVSGDFEEWQFSLGIAKEFGETVKFIPYAGVKYSDVEVQAKGTILGTVYQTNNVNSKDTMGGYAGAEVAFNDNLSVYVEGRFVDESAFSTGITWKF